MKKIVLGLFCLFFVSSVLFAESFEELEKISDLQDTISEIREEAISLHNLRISLQKEILKKNTNIIHSSSLKSSLLYYKESENRNLFIGEKK